MMRVPFLFHTTKHSPTKNFSKLLIIIFWSELIMYIYVIKLKIMIIELTVSELNDLYYCLGRVRGIKDKMIENDEIDRLMDLVRDGIMSEVYNEDELI